VILVDTSVWVDHLRRADATLIRLLDEGQVLTHPFVIGEVAMGNLARRRLFLEDMRRLPLALVASDPEAMSFMEREQLYGRGIGFADLHLLAATRLTPHTALWSRDRRLRAIAVELGLASSPN
jgi:predicted nucleic acid-binding protein